VGNKTKIVFKSLVHIKNNTNAIVYSDSLGSLCTLGDWHKSDKKE